MTVVGDVDEPGAPAHVDAGEGHDASGDGGEEDEEHQGLLRVEVDHDEVGVLGVVVAGVDGAGGVVAAVAAVVLVEGLALLGQGVDAPLDVDLEPERFNPVH